MYTPPSHSGGAPPTVKRSLVQITNFKGADLTSSEVDMDPGRSGDCPNMIRSTPGKVRKRMGYHLVDTLDGRINGAWLKGETTYIHAGTKVYQDGELLAGTKEAATAQAGGTPPTDTGLTDHRSTAAVVDNKLIIFDGVAARTTASVTENNVTVPYFGLLSEGAYIPTVMIGKNPDGSGGEYYEEVNSLSDKWTESFCVTADTKTQTEFSLSFETLTDAPVTAQILDADGKTWTDKAETTDFTVDRATGKITFLTAPGESPIDGKDNVIITASRDHSEQRSRINKCTVCIAYGNTATGVRLFCTGNPDLPNRDFWSAINDPTYFPDVNYSRLGRDDSAIIGYSIIGGYIAAHKDDREGSIYVRVPENDEEGMQQFKVSNVITGRGAVAPYSFCSLTNEPLFLTSRGIYAITTGDLTQEKYEQSRSYYLNGALTEEVNLSEAYACIYGDWYMLAINEKIYILDGTTREYSRNEPYSSYQYEGFYFTGIDARALWVKDDVLYFGDGSGNVYEFYKDSDSLASYNDNGASILAYWQTSALSGDLFYKNKSFKRCAVQLVPTAVAGVTVRVRKRGIWSDLLNYTDKFRFFDFRSIDFSRLSFATDSSARTVSSKIKVKKVDKAVFRFINGEYNTPFSISNIAFEFVESGNFKG